MDANRIEQLAAAARSLAGRVTRIPPDRLGPWMNELKGLLQIYFANSQPDPSLTTKLDAQQVGALISHSQYLLGRASSMPSSDRENVSRRLLDLAIILEQAATHTGKSDAPHPSTESAPIGDTDSGTMIGPWRLLESKLGQGGQGEVLLAWHERWRLRGALKRLISKRALSEKGKTRFLRELEAFRRVQHPFVVKVLDASTHPEPYLVTEIAPFGSLHDNRSVYRGDFWRTLRMARDIALGLAAVHDLGIVHRDVKPKNVLLHSLDHARVADFGIAHFDDLETITSLGSHPRAFFFAPIESEFDTNPTPAFDVFSLGATIHWALTGRPTDRPYRLLLDFPSLAGEYPTEKAKMVDGLLQRMTAREPTMRCQSMLEVVSQLDVMLDRLLGSRHLENSCPTCESGVLKDIGALQFGSGTEINVHSDGPPNQNAFALTQLRPRLLMCTSCGILRLKAAKMMPFGSS